jgi:hypothetical protein
VRELLVVVEKVFKEQNINLSQMTNRAAYYKLNYNNKVLVKHNNYQLKLLDNSNN